MSSPSATSTSLPTIKAPPEFSTCGERLGHHRRHRRAKRRAFQHHRLLRNGGRLFYSADDFVTNPLLPLASGITPKEAESKSGPNGGGGTKLNPFIDGNLANSPYVNPDDFSSSFPRARHGVAFRLAKQSAQRRFAIPRRPDSARPAATYSARLSKRTSTFPCSRISNQRTIQFEVPVRRVQCIQPSQLRHAGHRHGVELVLQPGALLQLESHTAARRQPKGWGVISGQHRQLPILQMSLHLTF